MGMSRIGLVLVLAVPSPVDVRAQQSSNASEDQVIAEALWAMVDRPSGDPVDSTRIFAAATKAYPNSAKADVVVVPVDRLFDASGEVLPILQSSNAKFIAAGSPERQPRQFAALKKTGSVVGVLVSQQGSE